MAVAALSAHGGGRSGRPWRWPLWPPMAVAALAAYGGGRSGRLWRWPLWPPMAVAALAAYGGGRSGRLWRREAWSLCWLKSPGQIEYAELDRSLLGSSGEVLVYSRTLKSRLSVFGLKKSRILGGKGPF
jgi:hypothetical protein